MSLGADSVRILFADRGTTVVVRDDGHEEYLTLDIPRRVLLQVFPDPPR